jgi:hypothetical protein
MKDDTDIMTKVFNYNFNYHQLIVLGLLYCNDDDNDKTALLLSYLQKHCNRPFVVAKEDKASAPKDPKGSFNGTMDD